MAKTETPKEARRRRVVIVGGGFGGLFAAKALARHGMDILLLDRRNHHLFQPLLYQVAMAGLSPAEISFPIRSIFSASRNVRVLLAEVQRIDSGNKRVETDAGTFDFDYLILACGSEHSYFGHDDWEEHAPGLKTLEQATEIRRRVLTAFERAEALPDAGERRPWLTFVVVGGGPTGVELAGALGELTHFTLSQDFRAIDPNAARIVLVESGPHILSAFRDDLAQRAKRDLEALGVQVRLASRVSEVEAAGVRLSTGELIAARTVIWAAGVRPSRLNAQLGVPLDRGGRVIVEPDLSLPGHPGIFVIGDQAACRLRPGAEQFLPGLAPVAMQQGRFVGRQILADLGGRARGEFRYRDKGQMATIGRKRAVAEVGELGFRGFVAWWVWLIIHIYYLIGFRNRVFVLWSWVYSYLTYRRGARLITQRDWRLHARV